MGVLRNMKYENGGNQRSRAAPQIRRVLSRPKNDRFWRVFYPIPPIFFAFSPFPRTYKTNFAKKIRSGLHFLAAVEAQSFCLNSGRVATAYSTEAIYQVRTHFGCTLNHGLGPLFCCFTTLFGARGSLEPPGAPWRPPGPPGAPKTPGMSSWVIVSHSGSL